MPIQAAPTAIVATLAFLNVCALAILLLSAAFVLRPARGQRLPVKEANNSPAVPPRPESVYVDPTELHPGPKKRSPLNKYERPKIALPEPVCDTLTELNCAPSMEEEPIYEEVN